MPPTPNLEYVRAAHDELYVYTMGRPGFILRHAVDAFAVQNAHAESKSISIIMGLVGLYLRVEKQFHGRQVQRIHMALGQTKREWPSIHLTENRGEITVLDVIVAPPGPKRDQAIDDRSRSVWSAFRGPQSSRFFKQSKIIKSQPPSGASPASA